MPALSSFDYAAVRLVPRVEREEFLNAGVVLFCPEQRFLGTRVRFDQARLAAFTPGLDLSLLEQHLLAFTRVSAGDAAGGPIARLPLRERFHWLVSPRSTMLQVSPVHSGVCEDPQAALDHLFSTLVL